MNRCTYCFDVNGSCFSVAIVSYFDLGAVIVSFSDLPSIVIIAIDVKDLVALDTEDTVVENNEKMVELLKSKLKDIPRQNTLGQA